MTSRDWCASAAWMCKARQRICRHEWQWRTYRQSPPALSRCHYCRAGDLLPGIPSSGWRQSSDSIGMRRGIERRPPSSLASAGTALACPSADRQGASCRFTLAMRCGARSLRGRRLDCETCENNLIVSLETRTVWQYRQAHGARHCFVDPLRAGRNTGLERFLLRCSRRSFCRANS